MRRLGAVLFVSIAGALAVPVSAYAVDHVVLVLKPAKLAKTGPLAVWRLDGRMVDCPSSGRRSLASRSAEPS